ncbi:MAG: tetratricopeptide repeat-containing sensor histidine kinase [Flavobacteriaceae bacterium]
MFINTHSVFSQDFANKKHYLIDSLKLEELSVNERKLIDSALSIYHHAKHDTVKINAINIIVEESWNDFVWPRYNAWAYTFIKDNLQKKHLKRKRFQEEKLFWLKKKSAALNNFGVHNYSIGQYETAIENYLRSLAIKKTIGDEKGIASVYNNLGGIYDNKGNSPKALEYYLKSLKIRETKFPNDLRSLSVSFNNVGQSYYNQGDINKAKYYFEKSLEIYPKASDNFAKATILNNIGIIYSTEQNYPEALKKFEESLQIKTTIDDQKGVVTSLNSIGGLFKEQDKFDDAKDYFNQGLLLSKKIAHTEGQSISLTNLADVSNLEQQYSKGIAYANESIHLAKALHKPSLIGDAANMLYLLHKNQKNWEVALQMFELHLQMRDSIHNAETEKDLIRQSAAYDLSKKEQEIEMLSTQNELNDMKLKENRILIYFITAALLFTLILTVTIYYGNQKKQVINELLRQQKEEISNKNQEKELMLKEIHHRVKNNLQVVNSLLRFQSRQIEDEKVLEMFEVAQKRVLSMAKLHERMYSSNDLKHINVKEHITHLVKDLIANYTVDKDIDLEVDVDPIPIDIIVLTPLGLIINELITNSLKYGFPDRVKGQISVSLKHVEGNNELLVADDGVGYNPSTTKDGLGTKLVRMYAKQLNADLKKIDQVGTAYKLIF